MKTAITEMFGIDVPIVAFTHCRDVVAAVTKLVFLHLRIHTYAMGWTDKAVRRYVVRGNGRAFSTGGDLAEFGSAPSPVPCCRGWTSPPTRRLCTPSLTSG